MTTYPAHIPDDEPTRPNPVAGSGYRHPFPQDPAYQQDHYPQQRRPPEPAGYQPAPAVPAQRATQAAPAEEMPTPAPPKARSQWADTAKGVCIILVVLWHVIMKHYLRIDWSDLPVPLPGVWGRLGEIFLPMRMPVFFTISGMFAANAALRPWSVVRRSRVAKFFYLYAVWLLIHTVLLAPVPAFDTLHASNALQVLEQLTITPTNLWYLFALAVYFVIAKVSLKVPAPAIIGVALVINAIASTDLFTWPGNRGQLFQNLLFFLIGLRYKAQLSKLAENRDRRLLFGSVGAFLVVILAIQALGLQAVFGVWPIASLIAVVAGFLLAVQLAKVPRIGSGLAWLGQNTLPIYIIHMPLLGLWHMAALNGSSGLAVPGKLLLALVEPVLLTAFLVWLCLALHRGLQQVGGGFLFDLPGGGGAKKTPAVAAPKAEEPVRPAPEPVSPATVFPQPTAPSWEEAPTQQLRTQGWNDGHQYRGR